MEGAKETEGERRRGIHSSIHEESYQLHSQSRLKRNVLCSFFKFDFSSQISVIFFSPVSAPSGSTAVYTICLSFHKLSSKKFTQSHPGNKANICLPLAHIQPFPLFLCQTPVLLERAIVAGQKDKALSQ